MIEFIDKTETIDGTPVNRAALMAIQGFIASTTVFNDDGSITQTNSLNQVLKTVFNPDGSITETLTGDKTIVVKTTVSSDGKTITRVIS